MSSAAHSLPPDEDLPREVPRPPAAYSVPFWHTLATLPAHGVPDALAARALMIWWRVASARPPEPEVDLIRDETLRFAWSYDDLYMHLDVLEGGYEWFCRDHISGAYEGTEGLDVELPPRFFERLADLREKHPP